MLTSKQPGASSLASRACGPDGAGAASRAGYGASHAHFDSKLDRATDMFIILGLWLEDKAVGKDEAFAEA
jgi:hypothetical protein